MDQSQQYVQDLEKLFHASKDVLITTRANPRVDGVCGLLALARAFESMPLTSLTGPGQSRKVVKAVSGRQGSQYSLLPSSDTIVSELGLRDFVIGLPGYVDKAVDSVSWYVDQGRLHVVLKSNPAVPMQFDPKTFDPFYAGANFDVVCVVDADTPADLGNLYRQDPGMFTELPVVNVSTSPANTRFGRVNVVDTNVSCVSELIYEMLSALHVHIDQDTAALLWCGIQDGTEQMTQRATARTQEIMQELQGMVTTSLDLNAVRSQAAQAPLSVHPQGQLPVAPLMGMPPYGMPQGVPPGYPPYPAPYGQLPQPGQMVPPRMYPSGYGQMPGYPPQGYAGAQPGYPPAPPVNPGTQPVPSAFSQFHAPVGVAAPAQNQPYGGYQPQQGYQQPPQDWNQRMSSIPNPYNKGNGGEGGGRA